MHRVRSLRESCEGRAGGGGSCEGSLPLRMVVSATVVYPTDD